LKEFPEYDAVAIEEHPGPFAVVLLLIEGILGRGERG